MKKYISGLITGIIIMVAVVVSAAAVKQYILTPSTAKVFVNGAVQTVQGQPILEYNKNTYIPAAILVKSGVLKRQGANYIIGSATVSQSTAKPQVQANAPKKPAESYLQVIAGKNLVLATDYTYALLAKGYKLTTINNVDISITKDDKEIVYISKDYMHQYSCKGYTDYDFFVQNIYPLL